MNQQDLAGRTVVHWAGLQLNVDLLKLFGSNDAVKVFLKIEMMKNDESQNLKSIFNQFKISILA